MADTKSSPDASAGFCGCLFVMGIALFVLFLFSGGGSSGSADHVLRQERDAQVEAFQRASDLNNLGDPDAARQVMREREAHLNERIQEIQSSSSYSAEDRERMLSPMELERDTLRQSGQQYDRIGR